MDIIVEFVKIVVPVIIAGLFSFFIAKYKYNRNVPLNKLEIAYNRIYFPLYRMISVKDINIDEVISKGEIYFTKYEKYADISTKRLFLQLKDCKKEMEKELIYQRFRENVFDRNSFLRIRLGYLEPSIVQIYKYSTSSVRWHIRIFIYFLFFYIAAILYGITFDNLGILCQVSLFILVVSFVFIILDSIWYFLSHLLYKIYYGIKKKVHR